MRHRAVITIFLAAFIVAACAGCSIPGSEVVDGEGIVGTYTLNGVDTNDLEYSGTVVIESTQDPDVFGIQWIITGAIHEGSGVLSGDTFEAEWRSITTPRGESAGTASYVLDDEGNFTGTRTIDGVDGIATEQIFQDA